MPYLGKAMLQEKSLAQRLPTKEDTALELPQHPDVLAAVVRSDQLFWHLVEMAV